MIDYEKLLDALKTIQDECEKIKSVQIAQIARSLFREKKTTAALSLVLLLIGS